WITMALCFLQVLREPVVQYLAGSEQRIAPFWNIITWYPTYEYRSVIITTNKDFTAWGEFFADDNVAVPIGDRLIHHSHVFMLGGESYRLKHKREG
uniref:ATP-binding protein n=1 Tax=Thiolapillus sp. TaxID=2017437 RepID=UPI003AF64FA5